nr:RNA-directed DNA polymerase, eukaryota [Tanacetum cinerariifolium]
IVDKTEKRFNKSSHNTFHKTVGNKDIGNSFVNVVKGSGMSLETESTSKIVLDDECLNTKDLSCSLMGRVEEFTSLFNLKKVLCNEGFDILKISYLGHTFNRIALKWGKLMRLMIMMIRISILKDFVSLLSDLEIYNCNNESDVEEVPETCFNVPEGQKGNLSEDLFGIYPLLNKDKNIREHKINKEESSLKHPWDLPRIKLMIVVVYAPQEASEKRMLWDYVTHVSNQWNGEIVMMGDFNKVRYKSERFGSNFKAHDADIFNSFIHNAGLNEVHLGGSAFTWCHKSATKMTIFDYGPIPFRFYNYWLEVDGFDKLIRDAWNDAP